MTDAFIPPAPERPDHRRAALEDALVRLETKLASIKEHEAQKRANDNDRIGIEHVLGVITGLLVARDLIRSMIKGRTDA